MDTIESSGTVLHRGRAEPDRLSEEEAEPGVQRPPQSERERQQMIAVAAYYRAQGRNFEPGRELEDWLEAEAEIDALSRAAL